MLISKSNISCRAILYLNLLTLSKAGQINGAKSCSFKRGNAGAKSKLTGGNFFDLTMRLRLKKTLFEVVSNLGKTFVFRLHTILISLASSAKKKQQNNFQ